jgi:type 1 glutamine amidotransferase/azurin
MFEPVGEFNNNTWGLGFTENFEVFGSTANNNHICYVGIPLRYYNYLARRPSWAINSDFIQGHYEITPVTEIPLQQVDVRGGYTAAAGANFYVADHYPEQYRGQMYVNEPTGHLVHIARIEAEGAGYKEVDGGNIFASTDAWTAPVYAETGPDGNLWVADWYNPVIQHNPDARGMDNQIWNDEKGPGNAHLNPLRDLRHGRIYVIKHKGSDGSAIQSLDATNAEALMEALESPNMFWRTTAQRLLVEHHGAELIPGLISFAGDHLDSPAAIHALWTLHSLGPFSQPEAIALLNRGLEDGTEGVKRAVLAMLPASADGTTLLLESGLLESEKLGLRLAAVLRASELPESEALNQRMQELRLDPANQQDKWLSAAFTIYFREQNLEQLNDKEVDLLIPTTREEVTEWKYTTDDPGEDWYTAGYDDSQWSRGKSGFGTEGRKWVNTVWDTKQIWLRKEIELGELIEKPVLRVAHDEKYQVYINGELLFEEGGSSREYKNRLLEGKSGLFRKGKNLVAISCENNWGAQYIDMGLGKVAEFRADRRIELNTVLGKLAYETTTLHATAGQQVEITLNNVDQMPHNMVIIQLGSLEAFGKLVDAFVSEPAAAESEYVPESRYVIASSEMLDPGETGVIRFVAPNQPGEYPFVCTFPGHWTIMQGKLVVSPAGTYLAEGSKTNIAAMGGGGSHDFLRFFGTEDGQILAGDGSATMRYTEDSEAFRQYLDRATVAFISNNKPFDQRTKSKIFDRVGEGMAMMINHPSTWYNWEDWPEYNRQLVGGGSRSHEKLQEFEVEVVKPGHPIMKGVPARFRIIDELYRWEKDPQGTAIEVLAIGRGLESGETFPVVWVVKHPKSRIVGNTLGHDEDAHGHPAYQTILRNSLNWVEKYP